MQWLDGSPMGSHCSHRDNFRLEPRVTARCRAVEYPAQITEENRSLDLSGNGSLVRLPAVL